MKFTRYIYCALLTILSVVAASAELTFDVRINRGAEVECNPQFKKQTIAIFAIDCSGSMVLDYIDQETKEKYNGPSGKDKAWSRERLIREKLLPERLEALPVGTQVYAYLYGKRDGDWLTKKTQELTSSEITNTFLKDLQEEITKRVAIDGVTPYYDAMEMVLDLIKKSDWLNDSNVNLMLFDYTDGMNATGTYKGFSYPSNHWAKNQKVYNAMFIEARSRFNSKWGDFLKLIAENGFYEQLNVGTMKENEGVKHIPTYKVAFTCDKSALRNPQDVASQTIPLYVSFPMNQENWNLLVQQDKCKVNVRFGDSQGQDYPVSLKASSNPIRIVVPASALNETTKITVFFDCPKEVPRKFTLVPPVPIILYLPAPNPTIENVTYSPKTVLKGEKVYFTAEGCAKNYIWSFNDTTTLKSVNYESVSRIFERNGVYDFSVSPENNPKSKKEGRIEVVDIGVQIKNQGSKTTVTGKEESFEAIPSGSLKPSSCEWYVVGPIDPNAEDNPEITHLDSQSNPLQSHHFFRKSGDYKIKLLAKYDKLPLKNIEKETPWTVVEPAAIRFSDSMKGEGAGFEFGAQVELAIDVTSGSIDEKSIVWRADGKEIPNSRGNRKVVVPEVRGQGQIKVMYSVEVMDAALKTTLSLRRTYSFGCNHTNPIVKAVRTDGSVAWGVGDEVEFIVTPEDQYENIIWTFGDESNQPPVTVTNGQKVVHRAAKAGKFTNTMTCECRKCHTIFREIPLETETQYKEPKSRLTLKPEKSHYGKDEGLLLCDVGEGDYFKCRLMKLNPETGEFEEYKTLERNFEEEISMGTETFPVPKSQRVDFVFKIQALDKDGNPALDKDGNPVESAVRTVRVRNHIIALLILGGVIILLLILLWFSIRLLIGQGPSGWILHYRVDNVKPVQENLDAEYNDVKGVFTSQTLSLQDKYINDKYKKVSIWNMWKRQARIPLSVLGILNTDNVLVILPKADEPLTFNNAIQPLFILRDDELEYGAIYRIIPPDGDEKEIKYLRLLLQKSPMVYKWQVLFIFIWTLLALAFIASGVWLFRF